MSTLSSYCLRCPFDEASICRSTGDKPETLLKCESANEDITNLWPAFTNDPSSEPPTLLAGDGKCKYFIVSVYKDNKSAISTFKKKVKKAVTNEMLAELASLQSAFTVDVDGTLIPVTKQMLEYSYGQYISEMPAGKGKEKKVSSSNVVPSSLQSAPEATPTTGNHPSEPFLPSIPSRTFPTTTQSIATEPSIGPGNAVVTQELSSSDVIPASSSSQIPKPFGQHLKTSTPSTHFGTTSNDKLGVQPTWRCGSPAAYQESTAAPPFSKQVHTTAPKNVTEDVLDLERSGKRDGGGSKKINVITNYLRVTMLPKQVYEYSLAYGAFIQSDNAAGASGAGPRAVTQRAQKEQIFKALRDMDPLHGNDDWATDYNTVWSLKPLRNPDQSSSGVREPVVGETFTTQRVDFHKFSGKPSQIDGVKFCFTRKLNFSSDPKDLVSSGEKDAKGGPIHVTSLNALLSSKVVATNLAISTGPNKFYARDDHRKFLGIQAHRGYFTSIRPGTKDILLNVSTMTGAFYQPIRVSDFMMEMQTPLKPTRFEEYGRKWHERCVKLLAGRSVRILYDRTSHDTGYDANSEANRHRVVVDVGLIPSKQMFGEGKDEMSVRDYFVKKLRASPYPRDDVFCVNVGIKLRDNDPKTKGKQIWIPAEYVALDPDQPFARRLAPPHMEAIHKFAVLRPAAVQDKIIKNGFNLLGLNGSTFKNLDIEIVPELLLIPARSLPQPALLYRRSNGNKAIHSIGSGDLASWNLRGVHFLKPASAQTPVSTIDFRSSFVGGDQALLANAVTTAMKNVGMVVPAPANDSYWWSGCLESHERVASEFTDQHLSGLMQSRRPANGPGLHIVILENDNSDSYATIKRVFDQHVGSHTVCITAAKLPGSPQLLGNLSLKFNLKLRGINHLPAKEKSNVSILATMLGQDTMVVGADVSHAPSQMKHCPSVAAVVANDEHDYANFPGSMRLQASKQEFLQDLYGMMVERLRRYAAVNHQLPSKIIFFRDGVGEDMYDRVRDEEIKQINSAYDQLRSTFLNLANLPLVAREKIQLAKLRLTFIIVGKRHHTRFFCNDVAQADNNGNVKPGLIVDSVITRPKLNKDDQTFDFFLQSHQALHGTARSGHYVVLEKGAFNVTDIQTLTHAFCFNYARATKGVSYAGPAYYADRLAERGTLYLKAYTNGKQSPSIDMIEKESKHNDTRQGERMYEERVARHVQESVEWNPRVNDPVAAGTLPRINPWHPAMDTCMFWL